MSTILRSLWAQQEFRDKIADATTKWLPGGQARHKMAHAPSHQPVRLYVSSHPPRHTLTVPSLTAAATSLSGAQTAACLCLSCLAWCTWLSLGLYFEGEEAEEKAWLAGKWHALLPVLLCSTRLAPFCMQAPRAEIEWATAIMSAGTFVAKGSTFGKLRCTNLVLTNQVKESVPGKYI